MVERVLGTSATTAEAPPTLETLFRQHCDDVSRIVGHLLGPGASDADVDDVTQMVFVAAHRALPRFRGDSKTSTWLYGIASNTVLHHLRGRRRYRQMLDRIDVDDHIPMPSDVNPEELAARRERLRGVWRALLSIKPKKRVVFLLSHVEGLSSPEIAEILQVSEATVRSRLRHARLELEARLEKERAR